MKNLDRTIATVNRFNPGVFKDLRGDFNTQLDFNQTADEDAQKWADVYCDCEAFGITESQNLTAEEETDLMDLLEYLQGQFRKDNDFYRTVKQTEYSLLNIY